MNNIFELDARTWNVLKKPDIVDTIANQTDLLCKINGYLFLIQTRNGFNNVLCYKLETIPGCSFLKTLYLFRDFCIEKGIQFLRVEGNRKRYWFLSKLDVSPGYSVLRDKSIESRNVFFIKLF